MVWENVTIKNVVSELSNKDKLKADGSYNTTHKLADDVVMAMIYAENDLLPKPQPIYVRSCGTDPDPDEWKIYKEGIIEALKDGKKVLMPVTNGKHFVLVAVMPQRDNGILKSVDVVYMNSTIDKANPQLIDVGKEVAKGMTEILGGECDTIRYRNTLSREIQYGECCGLSVVQNALNVIKSDNIAALTKNTDALKGVVDTKGKQAFYQELGIKEHEVLTKAPVVQEALIQAPVEQQKLDRQLAFALQREEIDKLMNNDLAKAVKAKDKEAVAHLLVQVGIALGEYGYADFEQQNNARTKFVQELSGKDMASAVGDAIKNFGVAVENIPDDFKQMRKSVGNSWQAKIRQEQQVNAVRSIS